MWKIKISILLVTSLIIGLSACNTKEKTPSKTEIIQQEKLDSIETNLEPLKVTSKGLTFNHQDSLNIDFTNEYVNFIVKYDEDEYFGLYYDLLFEDIFVKVMENSNPYIDHAINLLNTNKLPERKKSVLMVSMATLTLENRIKFIESCVKLYMEDKLSESILAMAFGGYFGDKKLYFEYKKEKVKISMKKIIHNPNLPKLIKEYAEETLNGSFYKRYQIDKEYLKYRAWRPTAKEKAEHEALKKANGDIW